MKQFAGEKDDSCVREISYTSGNTYHYQQLLIYLCLNFGTEVAFANGCRAPPWKQVLGDICYIKVVPCDGVEFCVTASTVGYYVNKVLLYNGILQSLLAKC